MNKLLSRRLSRTDYFAALVLLNLLFVGAQYGLSGRLELTLQLGLRSKFTGLGQTPWIIVGMRLAFDALLLWFMMRRVQDAALPGWYVFGLFLLPLALGSLGAFVALAAIIAVLFIPGTIGPNRFGPDPRGWKSREHYEEQQERLRSGTL